jgi:hypothetical protein
VGTRENVYVPGPVTTVLTSTVYHVPEAMASLEASDGPVIGGCVDQVTVDSLQSFDAWLTVGPSVVPSLA